MAIIEQTNYLYTSVDGIFYHACPIPLAVGSIILNGNFGKNIPNVPINNDYNQNYTLFLEYVFEEIRKQSFPDKPSRLKSSFVCPNKISMIQFLENNNRMLHYIYQVKFVNSDQRIHYAPIDLLNIAPPTISCFETGAKNYWNWDNKEACDLAIEVLCESPIEILSCGQTLEEFKQATV